jgi:hypothetical protein
MLRLRSNVLRLTDDRMQNKKSKRAAVSSDGKQPAPGKKKRRLVKAVKKEEESPVKKEEEIEDDLQQDEDKLEDSKQASTVVKKEEEDETEMKEGIEDDVQLNRDEPEDCKKPPAPVKKEEKDEVELKEDGEDILHLDKNEREDSKKPPAAVKEEEDDDEVGHDYSTGEIDGESNWEQLATWEENDDEATYMSDQNTATKPLHPPKLPSVTDTIVKTASSPTMTLTKPNSAKPVAIGHAAITLVPIVQANSALAPNPVDEKHVTPGRGYVCIENKTISEQPGGTQKKDTSINTRRYPKRSGSNAHIVKKNYSLRSLSRPDSRSAERSRPTANIVSRKYSLRSLSQQNNKKSARSKPLRKDKGSSTSLGEVCQSPMASSDEDEFGRSIESDVDEASDTSDSVDGIIDHDEAMFNRHYAQWNSMYERLRAFKEGHGHCELFWAVNRFAFILNTPTYTPPLSLSLNCR